ncbi:hypothetical protein M878_19970 [Streptomyces roseochromogenus subsp. oscitans DS 12.976]|uniref:Uncharacterized protein n=1 Tax=Streptomyces roseochromogenus subsp. oscitans DS 12.976 TaxID=1352936 RepID=V6KKU4_STRRC|nr:hypothetical protein M878_19970 [Streptomyces roseochromogenus subsp. oscitans DS 12.976]
MALESHRSPETDPASLDSRCPQDRGSVTVSWRRSLGRESVRVSWWRLPETGAVRVSCWRLSETGAVRVSWWCSGVRGFVFAGEWRGLEEGVGGWPMGGVLSDGPAVGLL